MAKSYEYKGKVLNDEQVAKSAAANNMSIPDFLKESGFKELPQQAEQQYQLGDKVLTQSQIEKSAKANEMDVNSFLKESGFKKKSGGEPVTTPSQNGTASTSPSSLPLTSSAVGGMVNPNEILPNAVKVENAANVKPQASITPLPRKPYSISGDNTSYEQGQANRQEIDAKLKHEKEKKIEAETNTINLRLKAKGLPSTVGNKTSELIKLRQDVENGDIDVVDTGNGYAYGRVPAWNEAITRSLYNSGKAFSDTYDILTTPKEQIPQKMQEIADRKNRENHIQMNFWESNKTLKDKLANADLSQPQNAEEGTAGKIAGFAASILPDLAAAYATGGAAPLTQAALRASYFEAKGIGDTAGDLYHRKVKELVERGVPQADAEKQVADGFKTDATIASVPNAMLQSYLFAEPLKVPALNTFEQVLTHAVGKTAKMSALGGVQEAVTQGIEKLEGYKPEWDRIGENMKQFATLEAVFGALGMAKYAIGKVPKYFKANAKEVAVQPEIAPIVEQELQGDPNAEAIKQELANYTEATAPLRNIVPEDKMAAVGGRAEKLNNLTKEADEITQAKADLEATKKSIPEALHEDIDKQIEAHDAELKNIDLQKKQINKEIEELKTTGNPLLVEKDDITGKPIAEEQPETNDITVGDMIDKKGSYNGQRGTFIQDEGGKVEFHTDKGDKVYDLGNINDLKDVAIKDFGIEHEESVVKMNNDGTIGVRGKIYTTPDTENPLKSIQRDKEGNITGVKLLDENGNTKTFRKQHAEDLAYQLTLKELNKDNESKTNFEQFISSEPEATNEANNAGLSEDATKSTNVINEEVPHETIEPTTTSTTKAIINESEKAEKPLKSQDEGVAADNEFKPTETGGDTKAKVNEDSTGTSEPPPTDTTPISGDGSSEDMTKMANAINDAHVEGKFGSDALDKIMGRMQDTNLKAIYEKVKLKAQKDPKYLKEVRDRLMTTKQGSEADQAALMYDLAELKGREKSLTKEINEETNPENIANLQRKLAEVQNDMMDNAEANRSIGRTASTIFRLRQLWVNQELSLADMEESYMASKAIKELTPEQRKEVKAAHNAIREARAKLDIAKDELDAAKDENARLKIENEKLQKLKGEATEQKKADRAKKSDEAIAKSKEREQKAKDELRQLRQGMNDVTRVLPKTAIAIGKLAAEKVYQGIVKFDELVKNVWDDVKDIFPEWTEEDVIRHILADVSKDGKTVKENAAYKYIAAKERAKDASDANLKLKVDAYKMAQRDVALKQFEWLKDRRMDMMKSRPVTEQIIDSILRWQRFAVLTYPTTFIKLGAVVAHQLTLKPLKFAIQKLITSPIMTAIGANKKASIWGNPKWQSLAAYYSAFIKNFALSNLKEQFSGVDTKELLYGKPMMYDEFNSAKGLLEMPGRSHGYIKSFIKNPEFAFAHQQQIAFHLGKMEEIRKELQRTDLAPEKESQLKLDYDRNDITNEDTMERINKLALEHGKWSILMNDSPLVDLVRRKGGDNSKKPLWIQAVSALAKSEMPIVKIPVNYVSRAFATKYGLAKALTGSKWMGGQLPSIFSVIKKGSENLTEEQANLLGRTLSIGSMGAAFFALGYYNRKNIQTNEDGSISINGVHISKNLVHTPEYESIFSGAETGNTFDKEDKKKATTFIKDFLMSDIDIAKKSPFTSMLQYGFIPNVATALMSKKDNDAKTDKVEDAVFKKFADMTIPGFVKQPASWLDSKNSNTSLKGVVGGQLLGTPVKRKPRGEELERFWQTFELGLPVLRSNVPKSSRQ